MFKWVLLFFDICRFQKGPQDIPYSPALLSASIAAYSAVGFLMIYIDSSWFSAVLQTATGALLLLGFVKILVGVTRKPGRFLQTTIALFGTDALISFIALPVIVGLSTGRLSLMAFGAMIGLMIWHWLVTGHIVRHVLSESFSFGLGIAFLYILASYWLMALLFA